MEADLLRFYGVDLLDLWRNPRTLTLRRVGVLVRNIPEHQGSAVRALDGPEWSIEADLLDSLRRWYEAVHSEAGDPGPHQRHPAAEAVDDGPTDAGINLARQLRAERQAQIEAGEID